ncbi:MAG: hypothetical protein IPK67_14350 [Planctomycetes bacterium]|nr:hypothetical protein [Planctomycetota bacterium]
MRQKPYLKILCIYMILQTICATFFYTSRRHRPREDVRPRRARRFFADINFWVNDQPDAVQVLFTGNLLAGSHVRCCWPCLCSAWRDSQPWLRRAPLSIRSR